MQCFIEASLFKSNATRNIQKIDNAEFDALIAGTSAFGRSANIASIGDEAVSDFDAVSFHWQCFCESQAIKQFEKLFDCLLTWDCDDGEERS